MRMDVSEKIDHFIQLIFHKANTDFTLKKGYILKELQILTEQLKNEQYRSAVDEASLGKLLDIAKIIAEKHDEDSITEILRVFRNVCASSQRNQLLLYSNGTIQFIISEFLTPKETLHSEMHTGLALQVIGNSIVANSTTSNILLSQEFNIVKIMENMLDISNSEKIRNYTSMIGLTLTKMEPIRTIDTISTKIVKCLICSSHLEFPTIWIEELSATDGFVAKFYEDLDQVEKVQLIHLLSENGCRMSVESLDFLMEIFKKLADQLLSINQIPDEFNVLEVTTLVEFFCKVFQASSKLTLKGKSDLSFVSSVIILLKTIHELGETDETNIFSPLHKINDTLEAEEIESKPEYQFKGNLIRLIGIIVESNRTNQNQVRELGCLPVILNCTKIDGKNPFIPQISILTLKYLLDGNQENQAFVASLQQEKQ